MLSSELTTDNMNDNLYDKETYKSLMMMYHNGPCYTYTAEEIKRYRNKLIAKKLLEMKKNS